MKFQIVNAKENPPTVEEIRDIVDLESHPKVKEWLLTYVDSDPKNAMRTYRKFFKRLPRRKKVDILLAKRGNTVIGFLALWRLGRYMWHVASIGVSVHPDYWGKGATTRLVESAIDLARREGLRRLEIETLAENAAMRTVAVKIGFKLERLRKDRLFKDGEFHDEASYYMLL